MQDKGMQIISISKWGLSKGVDKQSRTTRRGNENLNENRGTENLRDFRMQTSIWFLICVTLLFTSSCVVPSPTIVVESLVTTTLAAVPRTWLSALSKDCYSGQKRQHAYESNVAVLSVYQTYKWTEKPQCVFGVNSYCRQCTSTQLLYIPYQ